MTHTIRFMVFATITTGCARAPIYIPNVQNVPMLTETHETQIAGHFTPSSDDYSGWDFHGSHSLSNRWMVMVNASYAQKEKRHERQYGEIGFGYYQSGSIDPFHVLAGIGTGSARSLDKKHMIESVDPPETIEANGKFHRFFIQAGKGANTGIFEGTLSSRVSYVRFYKFKQIDHVYDNNDNLVYREVINDKSNWGLFVEPALTGSMGSKTLRLIAQVGSVFPVSQRERKFAHVNFYVAAGFQLRIVPQEK